jgi:membrane associated rhomboid family serine protease
MFPIRDDVPSTRVPVVNSAIVAICSLVFLLQLAGGDGGERMAEEYGFVPARLTQPDRLLVIPHRELVRTPEGIEVRESERDLAPTPIAPVLTLLTCMFLHGGWMHIIGNMWFLVVFGDNVEDRYGHLGYLLFYLGCGLAASLLQLIASPYSPIPTIGASGAIAGVMGAYFIMFPRAQVLTLIPIFIFMQFVVLPAPLFLGIWFVFQLVFAAFSETGIGGVAFWAHVGGFAAGLGITHWLKNIGRLGGETRHVQLIASRREPPRWS